MAKIFTPAHILFTATKRKRTTETSKAISTNVSLEPSDKSVEFLLNYSKSLEVLQSDSIGSIDTIKN